MSYFPFGKLQKIGNGFDLLLDTGTFHGLIHAQRIAMGKAINKIASQNATILLLVWDIQQTAGTCSFFTTHGDVA